jgi:acyl-coenzyme A synthetase/AMP-(fatty) acid ligase
MTRVDDVINTAGHRLSTGRLEEVINEHPSVVESAVVGHFDEIRGDCPVAFVILKGKDGSAQPPRQTITSAGGTSEIFSGG